MIIRRREKTIGYLSVSTVDQDLEKNKADISYFANKNKLRYVEWVTENVSGTKDWQNRALGETISTMKAGDNLIVSELSRLGRSTLQILDIMKACKQKRIRLYAVKNGWVLNGSLETKTLLNIFAIISELERDLISQRTREALAARKKAGVKLGRPKGPGKSKLDPFRKEIQAMLKAGTRQNYIAKKYDCTPATLNNWIKKNEISTEVVF